MSQPSHFEMEQALRRAGVAVRPYPTKSSGSHEPDILSSDQLLIEAGSSWEREIERLHTLLLQGNHLNSYAEFAREFDELCTTVGMVSALESLNLGVAHRYTAVYRRTPSNMVNVALTDKLREPRPEFLEQVPVTSSFCQYVLRDGSFLTGDSGKDQRLDGHPYKGVLLAYSGVPVFDSSGTPLGTLCHFDPEARDISDESVAKMHAAARILTNYLS
jgi:hypothetical protein